MVAGCNRTDSNTSGIPGSTMPPVGKTVGAVSLVPRTILDGKLSLLVPDEFSLMTPDVLKLKYPGSRRPTIAFTNEGGSVNVAINHTQDTLAPNQIATLHQEMDATIRKQIPQAKWSFSGLQDYQGRKWMQLEFESPAVDTNIQNIMVASSVDGRMLLVSFNSTQELAGKWLEPGREIIKSLTIHE